MAGAVNEIDFSAEMLESLNNNLLPLESAITAEVKGLSWIIGRVAVVLRI